MNGAQRLIRFGGLLILIAMALYPPWRYSYRSEPAGTDQSRPAGYASLWNPPAEEAGEEEINGRYQIDLLRLGIQFCGTLVLMNVGIYYLRRKAL